MRDSTFESKAYGKRVNKLINIDGRVQLDLLQVRILEEGASGSYVERRTHIPAAIPDVNEFVF